MNKIVSRKGISLVALVITIIVLVVLTGAVVITGVNVPQQGQLAVFKSNVGSIQDAVTLKMLNNMADKVSSNNENVKWIGVASGYTEESIANPPTFGTKINGVDVVALDASLKNEMQIKDEEFAKYFIDENGIVYHMGFMYEGIKYYNASISTSTGEDGINEQGTTLASILENGNAYGTPVTGYIAGGISDWKVFYEDTTNRYVYLIASNVLTEEQIPAIDGATKGTYNEYGTLCWSSSPQEVQTMSSNSIFMANWSNYAANANGKCVSVLLNTNNWTAFATPSNTAISRYVEGAIGSPTGEMFVASWNAKNTNIPLLMTNKDSSETESTIGYYYNLNGTIKLNHSRLTTTGNELYFPKYNGNATYYFLACPSASTNSICRVLSSGGVSYVGINIKTSGIRPVVCLQSDIPATVTANGIDI